MRWPVLLCMWLPGKGWGRTLLLGLVVGLNVVLGRGHESGGSHHEKQGLLDAYTGGGTIQTIFVVVLLVSVVVAAAWAAWIYMHDDREEQG